MDRCEQLAHPSITNFALSCLLLAGIVVSYLPQHWRIIARRSSIGISPYFVLLGTTAGTFALANVLTLPTSRNDIYCCAVNSSFSCAAGLLGIAQITVQWGCFFLIMFLYLVFIPRQDGTTSLVLDPDGQVADPTAIYTTAITVVGLAVMHFMATFIISVFFVARFPQYLQQYASALGIGAAILASIQYFPQIYTTYQLKSAGALSIPMMMIQTPGGYLFAVSLAMRLGASGWSTWAQYVVLATLQAVLLVMALSYEYQYYSESFAHDKTVRGFLNHVLRTRTYDPESEYGDAEFQDEGGVYVEGRNGEHSPLLRSSFPPRGSRGERATSIDYRTVTSPTESARRVPTLTSPIEDPDESGGGGKSQPKMRRTWSQKLWGSQNSNGGGGSGGNAHEHGNGNGKSNGKSNGHGSHS